MNTDRVSSTNVVVLRPSPSLLRQLVKWIERHPYNALVVAWDVPVADSWAVSPDISHVFVDATFDAIEAHRLIDALVPFCKRYGVSVYTERPTQSDERFVRQRGMPYIDGPMPQAEWDAIILGVAPAAHMPEGTRPSRPLE